MTKPSDSFYKMSCGLDRQHNGFDLYPIEHFCMGVQARLGAPVLVMVQACTPPLLLAGPMGRKKLEPWRGILHSCNVVLAVMLSRFAIFDIVAVSPRRLPSTAPLFAEYQPIPLPHVVLHADFCDSLDS